MAARMGDAVAAAGHGDPVEIMRLCAALWLDACADPEIQRIVLLEALAVLGWERWSAIGHRYNIGFVTALLTEAIESGSIPRQPIEATALTIMGRCAKRRSTSRVRTITTRRGRTPAW